MKTIFTTLGISLLVLAGCNGQKKTTETDFIQDNINNAVAQETLQTDIIEKSGKILNPRTIDKDGKFTAASIYTARTGTITCTAGSARTMK